MFIKKKNYERLRYQKLYFQQMLGHFLNSMKEAPREGALTIYKYPTAELEERIKIFKKAETADIDWLIHYWRYHV